MNNETNDFKRYIDSMPYLKRIMMKVEDLTRPPFDDAKDGIRIKLRPTLEFLEHHRYEWEQMLQDYQVLARGYTNMEDSITTAILGKIGLNVVPSCDTYVEGITNLYEGVNDLKGFDLKIKDPTTLEYKNPKTPQCNADVASICSADGTPYFVVNFEGGDYVKEMFNDPSYNKFDNKYPPDFGGGWGDNPPNNNNRPPFFNNDDYNEFHSKKFIGKQSALIDVKKYNYPQLEDVDVEIQPTEEFLKAHESEIEEQTRIAEKSEIKNPREWAIHIITVTAVYNSGLRIKGHYNDFQEGMTELAQTVDDVGAAELKLNAPSTSINQRENGSWSASVGTISLNGTPQFEIMFKNDTPVKEVDVNKKSIGKQKVQVPLYEHKNVANDDVFFGSISDPSKGLMDTVDYIDFMKKQQYQQQQIHVIDNRTVTNDYVIIHQQKNKDNFQVNKVSSGMRSRYNADVNGIFQSGERLSRQSDNGSTLQQYE